MPFQKHVRNQFGNNFLQNFFIVYFLRKMHEFFGEKGGILSFQKRYGQIQFEHTFLRNGNIPPPFLKVSCFFILFSSQFTSDSIQDDIDTAFLGNRHSSKKYVQNYFGHTFLRNGNITPFQSNSNAF